MKESIRTAIFVAVAGVAALVSWISWTAKSMSEFAEPGKVAMEGKPLFPKFTDPLAATSLEIVKYDAQTASPVPFKVAQVDGRWSIPSHSNYPTDAQDQLAEAAASVIGLTVIDEASDDPATHEMYGVIDPTQKPADTPPEDVGVRVVMRDKDDNVLLGLVIGKEVPDRSELRYVRPIGENPVYTVAINTSKLSNKFEDWIEKDLLKLNSWDIKEIEIQDYSVLERGGRFQLSPGAQMTLRYDDAGDPKWSLVKDLVFSPQQGTLVPAKLADDEELDTEKLNNLKFNLDDLKIVDVRRKPAGLSADLRDTGTLAGDLETQLSLQSKGYYLVEVPVGDKVYLDLLSNQGELRVAMKDGVEYVLRFGEIASGTAAAEEEKKEEKAKQEKSDAEAAKEAKDSGESKTAGLNRYLFVMAQFNPDMIPKPELQPLPEAPAAPAQTAPAPSASAGEKPQPAAAEPAKPEAAKPDAARSEGGDGDGEGDSAPQEKSQPAPPSAQATEAKPEAAKPEAEKPEAEKAKPAGEEQKAADAAKAERERIEKENKRKQDEYNDKVEKGKKQVEELNARFADWYYIISDEIYKKIRLGRTDIIRKKKTETAEGENKPSQDQAAAKPETSAEPNSQPAPAKEGTGVSDFEKLKQEGLEGSEKQ